MILIFKGKVSASSDDGAPASGGQGSSLQG
jgi:hypothetical protein